MTASCDEIRARLLQLADAEVDWRSDPEVAAHLAECEECRLAHEELMEFDLGMRIRVRESLPISDFQRRSFLDRLRRLQTEPQLGTATLRASVLRVAALVTILVTAFVLLDPLGSLRPTVPLSGPDFVARVVQLERAGTPSKVGTDEPYHLQLEAASEGYFYVFSLSEDGVRYVYPMSSSGSADTAEGEAEWDFLGYTDNRQEAGTIRVIPDPDYAAFMSAAPEHYFICSTSEELSPSKRLSLLTDLNSELQSQAAAPSSSGQRPQELLELLRMRFARAELQTVVVE